MGYKILEMYIKNESELRAAEIECKQLKEQLYSMTLPQYDDSLGFIIRKSMRVEDAVIDAIEIKENHKMKYSDHYKSRKLLQDTLKALNDEEVQAYHAIVWNKPSKIKQSRLKELEPILVKKLCKYIVENRKRKSI